MASDIFLPKTGVYIDDVTLLEWTVDEGAYVNEGDIVLIMETDKVEADVPAEASGWVHQIIEADTTLPIGSVVGLIAETEEEYANLKVEK